MTQGMPKIVKGSETVYGVKYLTAHFKDFPISERQNILPNQYRQHFLLKPSYTSVFVFISKEEQILYNET